MKDWLPNIDQLVARYQPANKIVKPALSFLLTSIILSPFVNGLILVSYTMHFDVPIVDVVNAVSEIYIYMNLVVFYLVTIFLLFILLPALVSFSWFKGSSWFDGSVSAQVLLGAKSSTATRARNAYLIYRPFPSRYTPNVCSRLVQHNLSLGAICFYILIAYSYFKVESTEHKIYYNIILVVYVIWIIVCGYYTYVLFSHSWKRSRRIIDIPERRRHFQRADYQVFIFVVNLVSLMWIFAAYFVLLRNLVDIPEDYLVLIIAGVAPIVISVYYNLIIGEFGKNLLRIAGFSVFIIAFAILIWPGTEKLSRGAFNALRIGGEVPVEIVLKPDNNLGILNEVYHTNELVAHPTEENSSTEQRKTSKGIYEKTIRPFYLILYSKEKVYLKTVSTHQCISDHLTRLSNELSCQRLFSIPQEHIISIEMTENLVVDANNR